MIEQQRIATKSGNSKAVKLSPMNVDDVWYVRDTVSGGLGVNGIDFQSLVRFGMECQKFFRIGSVQN